MLKHLRQQAQRELLAESRFWRRSGSRVSMTIACRHTVPPWHPVTVLINPMPPRTTRKSNRPRVADRTMVDTVQPHGFAGSRNRMASSPPK